MWLYLFLIVFLGSVSAHAQTQQGYANERPNIVVDRSVLEDLKGYEPPPMFGDDTPSQPVTLPVSPTLTAPKAETLLSHPVQNFRVLTERKSQTQKSVPIQNIVTPPKIQKPKSTPPIKKETKKEIHKEIGKPAIVKPISPPSVYRPKASPTMPAVPPIHVDRDILPALPPTTPDIQSDISTPSIGERMIDASLEGHIEKDNEKIKEKLADTKNNLVKKPKENIKSTIKTPQNSLEFKAGQTDLTELLETQIRKSILPEVTNDVNARIQILSFASSPDKTENSARRISLARALNVRDYLKKMNIDVSRIDVRALASDSSVPPDRIDIVLLK